MGVDLCTLQKPGGRIGGAVQNLSVFHSCCRFKPRLGPILTPFNIQSIYLNLMHNKQGQAIRAKNPSFYFFTLRLLAIPPCCDLTHLPMQAGQSHATKASPLPPPFSLANHSSPTPSRHLPMHFPQLTIPQQLQLLFRCPNKGACCCRF